MIFRLRRLFFLAGYTFLFALLLANPGGQAAETLLSPPAPPGSPATRISVTTIYYNDELSVYYLHLLTLALEKTTPADGPFEIIQNDHQGGIERDRAMLIAGKGIDVMWGSVTRERREKMHVIPVDLLKGLNNYRLLLIRKSDQERFSQVKNLDDLRKFMVGAGLHWTDGRIMKNNGFSTYTSFNMPGMFKMLAAGRFDFISRGAHEISNDLRIYPDYNLAIEQTLILRYNTPLQYSFFVNKDNQKLAERLARGLKMAQADGSFDRLTNQLQDLREGEALIGQPKRRIIELNNNVDQ